MRSENIIKPAFTIDEAAALLLTADLEADELRCGGAGEQVLAPLAGARSKLYSAALEAGVDLNVLG